MGIRTVFFRLISSFLPNFSAIALFVLSMALNAGATDRDFRWGPGGTPLATAAGEVPRPPLMLVARPQPAPAAKTAPPTSTPALRPYVAQKIAATHPKFHRLITDAAQRHGLEPSLVKAVILAESGYNPRAVSSRGASGLMQLMPSTARALGVEDIFDPEHNINGGTKYLRQLLNQLQGDLQLALAAYNAGLQKVRRHRGVPPFRATRFYIRKVLHYYQGYRQLSADL